MTRLCAREDFVNFIRRKILKKHLWLKIVSNQRKFILLLQYASLDVTAKIYFASPIRFFGCDSQNLFCASNTLLWMWQPKFILLLQYASLDVTAKIYFAPQIRFFGCDSQNLFCASNTLFGCDCQNQQLTNTHPLYLLRNVYYLSCIVCC
jgi:hypothetical protein